MLAALDGLDRHRHLGGRELFALVVVDRDQVDLRTDAFADLALEDESPPLRRDCAPERKLSRALGQSCRRGRAQRNPSMRSRAAQQPHRCSVLRRTPSCHPHRFRLSHSRPGPIAGIDTHLQEPVERRISPVQHPRNIPMLDRVVVDVIHLKLVIRVVPYGVFPKTSLPDTPFLPFQTALRTALGLRELAGKSRFDLPPTSCKIVVAFGQCPDTMQMIRQYHYSLHRKRMCLSNLAESNPQSADVFGQQRSTPLRQRDGEEITTAL